MTFDVFHFDIFGKYSNKLEYEKIYAIYSKFEVSHIETSGRVFNPLQKKNILFISVTLEVSNSDKLDIDISDLQS